jgi:hypothetical protein
MKLEDTLANPDYLSDLERRQRVLEDELNKAVPYCSNDDPMIGDLKRRWLYLRHELDRLRHVDAMSHYQH